jgi:PHD/YefM family antitoxin component YafN of YafNO toxin-antitoxin module
MKKKRMTVSEARANLYDLVEYVTGTPDSSVVIERRSRKGRAVLVDEGHYRYLEAVAGEVRKEAESRPFRLAGSMRSHLSEDELDDWLDRNRKEQAELARKKMDAIFADD